MKIVKNEKTAVNTVELEIAVEADVFETAVELAYKKNVSKISIPGFRRGKAPRKFIEKVYGEGFFYEDAINATYPEAFSQAIKETKLDIVNRPEIEIVNVGKDGYTFKAVCITKPEIEIGQYKGLTAYKAKVEVSDTEIDSEIDRLRERGSRMITVEDRKSQNGDTVVIDFEGFVDGNAFEGGKGEGFSLVLGSGQFIPGFEEQLVGFDAGADAVVNVKFPEDYHAEELKGKDAEFKVKIHEIKVKELPELDDEFAKDSGEFETVAEMKADIEKKIVESKTNQAQRDFEDLLMSKVMESVKGEIPDVMYDNQVDNMMAEFEQRMSYQGLNMQTYMQYTGMNEQQMREQFKPQAEGRVKLRLALEKVVELEKIEASEEDIANQVKELAAQYGVEEAQVKAAIPEEEMISDITVKKAIDLIRDSAIVSDVMPEPEKKEETEEK